MGVGGGLRPGYNFSWVLLKGCYELKNYDGCDFRHKILLTPNMHKMWNNKDITVERNSIF